MATNVVLVVVVVVVVVLLLLLLLGVFVVIRFSIPQGSVVSKPIVMKLFTHINDNILRQATEAYF